MLAFGPIPSRRLGKSLGINNIPAKICTYSCIYCQLGNTINKITKRREFHDPVQILREAERSVEEAESRKEQIDYLTFVPDGEPTLDFNLGRAVKLLRRIDIPIAVLTNASLISREDVKQELMEADLVSLKIDTLSEDLWQKVDRPHRSLKLEKILQGAVAFSKEFSGTTITETMLIKGIDYSSELEKIANFLAEVKPNKAYIAVPTRPPTEEWVKPARENIINEAYQFFSKKLGSYKVELLIGYEGNAFAFTGNLEKDLLSITAVHPMREEAVKELLKKANCDWSAVKNLLNEQKLMTLEYENHRYYMRKLPSRMKQRATR